MIKPRTGWQIHGPLFLLALLTSMILTRGVSLIIPTDFYFTFQSLFSDRTSDNLILSLIAKTIAPAATGFLLGWTLNGGNRQHVLGAPLVSARRLRLIWSPTIFLSGFFAAFLAAWPLMVYWDLLSNPEIGHLKIVFFGLYLLYMLGFGYVTLFGFLGAIYMRSRFSARNDRSVTIGELSRVGALWLINSGVASAVMDAITK